MQADSPHPLLRSMTRQDPPGHTRLRKLVTRAFTARRIEALRPRIQQVTGQLIAAMLPAGHANLVGDFALPLPIAVIMDLLGVPGQRRPDFLYWAGICAGVSEGDLDRRQEALIQMSGYLDTLVESKSSQRGGGAGEGDLLDGLITARDEGDRLSHDELLAMAFLLLAAGYETTTSLIGNGVLALLHHPDQLAVLRAAGQGRCGRGGVLAQRRPAQDRAPAEVHHDGHPRGGHGDPGRRDGADVPQRGQPRPGPVPRPRRVRHRP